jgi:hypothetical protein
LAARRSSLDLDGFHPRGERGGDDRTSFTIRVVEDRFGFQFGRVAPSRELPLGIE